MSQWTAGAKEQWKRYCDTLRSRLQGTDADVEEVIEDIRSHVDTEIASAELAIVTEHDIQRIVGHLGYPEGEEAKAPATATATLPPAGPSTPPGPGSEKPKTSTWGSVYLVLFGVLLPLGAATFEIFTRICTTLFFDPLPTVWHSLFFFLIPLGNLGVYLAVRGGKADFKGLGFLNGLAIGAALFYTAWFLPILPFSFLAILAIGIGVCGLAPLLSLIAAVQAGRRLRGARAIAKGQRRPWVRSGLAAGLAFPLLLALPTLIAIFGLNLAVYGDAQEQAWGIRLIRVLGSKDYLLKKCYDNRRSGMWGIDWDGTGSASAEQIRGIYYLVTGKAFNTAPPNFRGVFGRNRNVLFEEWDFDQGGEVVGGQLRHVELKSSQLDGLILSDAAMGYLEWTMEFQNNHPFNEQEARCQLQLPPGGVVSRVTLWIDGVEREAAFGGREQTKEAYQSVAIRQRRDPLLVTTKGPDQVLVQCFPILPRGQKMKIRVGITFPTELVSREEALLQLPTLSERNFVIPEGTRHRVWIESDAPMRARAEFVNEFVESKQMHALRRTLTDGELSGQRAGIRLSRNPEVMRVWAQKAFGDEAVTVMQTLQNNKNKALIDKLVVVVDTSVSMTPHMDEIVEAIGATDVDFDIELILAKGVIGDPEAAAADDLSAPQAAGLLRRCRPAGGVDNVPALVQAWHRAASSPNGVILWIHSAQPHIFESADTLTRCWERRPEGPKLLHLQAAAGPNRIVENLDGIRQVQSAGRSGDLSEDLGRILKQFNGTLPKFTMTRERVEEEATAEGQKTSSHLIRLWARDEVEQMRTQRSSSQQAQAKAMAVQYQLVTPVSGAVVLETMEQYLQHNLQPVDPESVPTIPEPATLLLMGGGALLLRSVRGRRRVDVAGGLRPKPVF